MKTPSIKVEYGFNKETKQFLYALKNHRFPWTKKLVFNVFPDLKEQLESRPSGVSAKEIIKNFITEFRRQHQKKIDEITKRSKRLVRKKSKKTLSALAYLMDYNWPSNHPGYLVVPTILPYSPFGKNFYLYSILDKIRGKRTRSLDVLPLSVHEISHLIFFDILRRNEKKIQRKKISWLAVHYLKEILASVLINQKPLTNILRVEGYLGNTDLRNIYVLSNGRKKQISRFFQEIYEHERYGRGTSFINILQIMFPIILLIEPELKRRNEIWNKYHHRTYIEKNIFNAYRKPIQIIKKQ